MKINPNNINNQNFKSGLTLKVLKDCSTTNVRLVEDDFKKLGVSANFEDSKSVAYMATITANILAEISEKYRLPFDFIPPAIRVYKQNELILARSPRTLGFSIKDTKKVIRDEEPYIGSSIFLKKFDNNIFMANFFANHDYTHNYSSSSHFLSAILHEWFHSIHFNLLFKKYGYEGNCSVLADNYSKKHAKGLEKINLRQNRNYSQKVKEFLYLYLGEYSYMINSDLEIFAELMTKIVTLSLNKNCEPIKNPLDFLPKRLPGKVKHILNDLY